MRWMIFILLSTLLWAQSDIASMIKAYRQKQYAKVCHQGYRSFQKIKKSEDLLNMYAFSCLKSGYINRLAVPIIILNKTPYSRKNRVYFSTILLQKNILLSALADKERYSGISLPKTDHIISKLFEQLQKGAIKATGTNSYETTIDGKKYILKIEKNRYNYTDLIIYERSGEKLEKKYTFR
ncbi:MAG: hypothetical protein C6H99_00945 [Epsilonproteobacteria bacterium]|nr:hypothetical protein [Campylobacterota bacterium]NPA64824.1 hypothetical protein [Campylobacterota bacterium]